MSKQLRIVAVTAAVLLLIGAVFVAGAVTKSSSSARLRIDSTSEHGAVSLAFAEHKEELFAKAGIAEGPASWAEQNYVLNGGDAITAANIAGAQAASDRLKKHKDKHSTTSWYSLGPEESVYPAFLNRHGSRYVTSGRITALEISPTCTHKNCTVWIAAAGGGVWRTDKALEGHPHWENVSDGFFASGAIGELTYDAAHNTLYAGTGEDAAAGDAEAGVGLYKSTDGGDTWSALGGNANFVNRAIREVTVDPNDASGNTLYVADGRGVHGISSTTAGAVSVIPGAPGVGIWKSTDGGATFTLLAPKTVVLGPNPGQTFPSSFGSSRGATRVRVDPTHPGVIYASAYNVGVWRSTDNGANWTNIHPCAVDPLVTDPASQFFGTCGAAADRSEITLVTTPDGHTRMYQTEGDSGPPTVNGVVRGDQIYSRFFIANGVESGSPTFTDKTSQGLTFHEVKDSNGNTTAVVADTSSPNYATYNFCTGQCWYDQGVVSPPGHPNMVYVFGSFVYNESHNISNARGLLLSQDGGNTFTDLTDAATGDDSHHDGLHPDQHALVVNPSNPLQYWEGSDGGLMRSNGKLEDISSRCDGRGLSGSDVTLCRNLLSAAPGDYTSLNKGLQTLQFQSLSVNPADSKDVQGGTQDNGTFESRHSNPKRWPQTIFGDGGLSGFDATDRHFRFHTYFAQQVDVNFRDGRAPNWDWISDPLFAESALFYFPIITDPTVHGTMFAGLTHVWRTLDNGGPQAYLDTHCNEFTGDFTVQCGDWVRVGDPTRRGRLTYGPNEACPNPTPPPASISCPAPYPYGSSRSAGSVGWLTRAPSDNSTLWASTTTGRLFISKNADVADPANVAFTRLDAVAPDYTSLATNAPGRAISSISVDPTNPNHAYVSYLSYNALSTTPGHVFSVVYDPVARTATFTSLDGTGAGSIGDQPVNGVAFDPQTGDLYAATDFGVLKLTDADPANGWTTAASDLPVVTVAGLTINPDARQLLAATHGRGAYQLTLP
jgi:hypothetical protein